MVGEAYVRREICVSKSIGLALFLQRNLLFFFCFTFNCTIEQFPITSTPFPSRPGFNGRLFALQVWGS